MKGIACSANNPRKSSAVGSGRVSSSIGHESSSVLRERASSVSIGIVPPRVRLSIYPCQPMGVFGYSGRDADLLDSGRDAAEPNDSDAPELWAAPVASAPLAARLRLPGSKSLTNRELVLAALAEGPSRLGRPLHSRDSALMIEALQALGIGIAEVSGDGDYGPDLVITPAELLGGVSIDCGL